MNLFGIGSLEILIILMVAFLVLGPTRLVVFAKRIGKLIGELRSAAGQLTNIMEDEQKDDTDKAKDPEERP